MPFPCRSTKGLDCVFPIWFTQFGRVWFTHAMPRPCRSHAVPRPYLSASGFLRPRHSAAWERHGMCDLASAVERRHGATCPRSASSGYHAEFYEGSRSRLSVRIYLPTTRTFTHTALSENGMSAAWHVWINAARERNGMCELVLRGCVRPRADPGAFPNQE
jgi:hypothetical protein